MTSLERFADAFFPEQKKGDYTTYGRVASINQDGSYQVQLNASGTDTRCAKLCDAGVGDSVLVIVQSNGRAAAIGRVGGSKPSIELLWTNPAPTSSFAEQTVRFSGDYDAYVITARSATNFNVSSSCWITSSTSQGIAVPYYNAGENYRSAWPTRSSIGFAGGHPDNTRVIPLYIWGVRY